MEEKRLLAETVWRLSTKEQRRVVEQYKADLSAELKELDRKVTELRKTDLVKARELFRSFDSEPLFRKYLEEKVDMMSAKHFEALVTAYDIINE